jgi:HEPN domain-containing protein
MTDDYLKDWLAKASNDLKSVEHELGLEESEVLRDIACFHCQQAAEKYLKAFLIFHRVEFPKTHNVEYLLEKCAGIDARFSGIDVKWLTSFAVDVRYGDEFYVPDIGEVEYYYKIAKKIRDIVTEAISLG